MVENKDIVAIIHILKRVTVAVKLYPFFYTILYILCMVVYLFGPHSWSIFCDQMFFVSSFIVVCTLWLSKILKLCKWHKLECFLPVIPSIISSVDRYIAELSKVGSYINTCLIIVLFLLTLVNAYFVFIKPKQ